MYGPSAALTNHQRISPRQIKILQTLWSNRLRRLGRRPRAESSRAERLAYIAEIAGREVKSSTELNWREANRVIHRLLEEAKPRLVPPAGKAGGKTGKAAAGKESSGAASQDSPSEAQLWKIRQIARFLGWSQPGEPEKRLEGFLRVKFHAGRPEELTHDQAWRAIEALCAVGARERIKARRKTGAAIKREELTREVAALKHELQEERAS